MYKRQAIKTASTEHLDTLKAKKVACNEALVDRLPIIDGRLPNLSILLQVGINDDSVNDERNYSLTSGNIAEIKNVIETTDFSVGVNQILEYGNDLPDDQTIKNRYRDHSNRLTTLLNTNSFDDFIRGADVNPMVNPLFSQLGKIILSQTKFQNIRTILGGKPGISQAYDIRKLLEDNFRSLGNVGRRRGAEPQYLKLLVVVVALIIGILKEYILRIQPHGDDLNHYKTIEQLHERVISFIVLLDTTQSPINLGVAAQNVPAGGGKKGGMHSNDSGSDANDEEVPDNLGINSYDSGYDYNDDDND